MIGAFSVAGLGWLRCERASPGRATGRGEARTLSRPTSAPLPVWPLWAWAALARWHAGWPSLVARLLAGWLAMAMATGSPSVSRRTSLCHWRFCGCRCLQVWSCGLRRMERSPAGGRLAWELVRMVHKAQHQLVRPDGGDRERIGRNGVARHLPSSCNTCPALVHPSALPLSPYVGVGGQANPVASPPLHRMYRPTASNAAHVVSRTPALATAGQG